MKKIFTLLLFIMLSAGMVNAQYYYLPFINAGQNPGNLNNDTEYPVGGGIPAGWTSIHAGSAASPAWSSTATIPFSFNFNGSNYTQFKVSTSGVLTFDLAAATAPAYNNVAIPSALVPDNSICAWGISGHGSNDNIVTKTFGTAPNRQHWIFFSSYSAPGSTSWTYWSIVLEETSNNIYIVDQRHAASNIITATLGVQINSTTAVQVTGSPNVNNLASSDPTPADNSYYMFVQGVQAANEAKLEELTFANFHVAPANVIISGKIANFGTAAINSITVKYEIQGSTYTDVLNGLNIPSFGSYNFNHSTNYMQASSGNYPVKVWIELAGDQNQLNDTLNDFIGVLTFLPTKKVVFEEATGTWCGWCPRGAVYMDSLAVVHPTNALLVAVHNNDPMAVANYDAGMGALIGGYPSGVVDRKIIDIDPSSFFVHYNNLINDVPPCDVAATATHNAVSNSLTIDVSATFAIGLTGDYRFNCVVIEDNITGNTSGYNQVNYYSFQSQNIPLTGAGHNWQAEPNPVNFANMEYDHVGRAILGGFDGQAGSLPGTVVENNTYNHGFNYTLLANQNPANMHVIAWVSDYSSKYILNANKGDVLLSINDAIASDFSFNVYPNPATESTTINLDLNKSDNISIQIVDMTGKVVYSNMDELNAGKYARNISVTDFANGIYNIVIKSSNESVSKKLIIAR
ncbi:MAG TPA: Omp28-related outer membrane protein [Bacteroidia bacterium]|nr:Omp28-related outer membrane protein [Bacteroidia bacterium]HNT80898.1 Omp28-related outer membrane protein [Bacteroidia bacterium]